MGKSKNKKLSNKKKEKKSDKKTNKKKESYTNDELLIKMRSAIKQMIKILNKY